MVLVIMVANFKLFMNGWFLISEFFHSDLLNPAVFINVFRNKHQIEDIFEMKQVTKCHH